MKTRLAGLLAVTSVALLAQAGCATNEQWQQWRSHNTHFASGQHAAFSFRNQGERAEQVRPTDPPKSVEQTWWGRKLPMAAGQGGN
jgi:hypothetical protein